MHSSFQAPLNTTSYEPDVNGSSENQENSSEENQGMSVIWNKTRCGKDHWNTFIWKDAEKLELLRNNSYFRVEVSILCGRELIAMDRGGTSDPYVMIKQDNETLHKCQEKKKTVNPVWNDQSNVCIENVFSPLVYEVTWFFIYSLFSFIFSFPVIK